MKKKTSDYRVNPQRPGSHTSNKNSRPIVSKEIVKVLVFTRNFRHEMSMDSKGILPNRLQVAWFFVATVPGIRASGMTQGGHLDFLTRGCKAMSGHIKRLTTNRTRFDNTLGAHNVCRR